jgi:hypothetical protein
MYRKLCFLTSFVLVLALSGALQAATPVDVNNHSFELQADGNQVTCHMGLGATGEGVMGWTAGWIDAPQINAGWSGVDVNCGVAGMCDDCRDWHIFPDGNVVCYVDNGNWAYQLTSESIQAGMRYDMVIDGMTYMGSATDFLRGHLYYLQDPNKPDVNHIDIVTKDFLITPYLHPSGLTDWHYDLKVSFVAETGAAYDSCDLGIKFQSPATEDWIWVDDIRVYKQWATQAYGPNPDAQAQEVGVDANLIWSPGLWAKDINAHMVYFGSTWTEVNSATTDSAEYQITQSPNEWDPAPGSNILTLGETYYWRIDEVNEAYTPGPVPAPPNGIWKGEIWSFTVQGKARNPDPGNADEDVAKNVILHWTKGTQSLYHDIYFSSTQAEVSTATTASGAYRDRTNLGTELYDAGGNHTLVVDANYYWRIDEVNYMTVKGDVWMFSIADYILIDDFDYYANPTELRAVWKDSTVGGAGAGVVLVQNDSNFVPTDGNAIQLEYWNTGAPYYSETTRTYATAQDWSYAGNKVTELEIDWMGDANNVADPPMYVKLSDGSTTVQVNPGPNTVTEEWAHTWHIPLKDFSGVTLSSITKITVGIGNGKGEGGPPAENGTLYFDDMRLYPPRCYPDKTFAADFTDDCKVDPCDLQIFASMWCKAGGWFNAQAPNPGPIVEYLFEETSGTVVVNTGSYGSSHDMLIGKGVDANHTVITDPNNDPCWFSDADPCRGWTLWFDGNSGHPQTNYEGDTGDYLLGMTPLNLNSNTVTIATWLKPDPWLIDAKKGLYEQKDGFTGLLHTRDAGTKAAGLSYNFTGGYTYNGEIGYDWVASATWQHHSGILIPDWRWSLAALVVQPEGGTVYVADFNTTPSDTNDDRLLSDTHVYSLDAEEWDGIYGIACDAGIIDGGWEARFFRGQMDAVRVYDYSLTPGQMLGLAEMEGIVYLPLSTDADLCVGIKDPCDPCAPVDDQIDLCDFSKFADAWLEQQLWPEP